MILVGGMNNCSDMQKLISYKGVFSFDVDDKVSYSANYREVQAKFFDQIVEAHLFWIGLGVGIETPCKAVLLKHEVMTIEKQKWVPAPPGPPPAFQTYQEVQDYRNSPKRDMFQEVYSHIHSVNITATSNPWLQSELSRLKIKHPREMGTPTLGKIYKSELKKLGAKGVMSIDDVVFLENQLRFLPA
jgi:hypothetical protein